MLFLFKICIIQFSKKKKKQSDNNNEKNKKEKQTQNKVSGVIERA